MRRSIDYYNPPDDAALESSGGDELPPMSWVVSVSDDYEDAEPRVVVMLEEMGRAGYGTSAHLDPDAARRLRAAIGAALAEIGEPRGD